MENGQNINICRCFRVKCIVILILCFSTVHSKCFRFTGESRSEHAASYLGLQYLAVTYCIHFMTFLINIHWLHGPMPLWFIYALQFFFLFLHFCIWFFLAEAQQNCRHLEGSHHGYHMHMQHILLLCSSFWIDEKQRQTITSLLDWPHVRRQVSPHCLDDLSILKGSPSGEMDALFPEEGSLLVPLIFECCWRFADNRRTMRLRCAAETKSVTITFPFPLH